MEKILHIKTDENTAVEILQLINKLSAAGANIEVIDNRIYAYEKKQIEPDSPG